MSRGGFGVVPDREAGFGDARENRPATGPGHWPAVFVAPHLELAGFRQPVIGERRRLQAVFVGSSDILHLPLADSLRGVNYLGGQWPRRQVGGSADRLCAASRASAVLQLVELPGGLSAGHAGVEGFAMRLAQGAQFVGLLGGHRSSLLGSGATSPASGVAIMPSVASVSPPPGVGARGMFSPRSPRPSCGPCRSCRISFGGKNAKARQPVPPLALAGARAARWADKERGQATHERKTSRRSRKGRPGKCLRSLFPLQGRSPRFAAADGSVHVGCNVRERGLPRGHLCGSRGDRGHGRGGEPRGSSRLP